MKTIVIIVIAIALAVLFLMFRGTKVQAPIPVTPSVVNQEIPESTPMHCYNDEGVEIECKG